MQKRVLFARSADIANVNAQAKNAQNILRRWTDRAVRPSVFSFYEPDPEVAANPNVDVIKIAPSRFWRVNVLASYLKFFDAAFCPGIHHFADWAALTMRRIARRPIRVIATVEGLLGAEGDDDIDRRYSEIVGHPVFVQKVPRAQWRRMEALKHMASHCIAISPFLGRLAELSYKGSVSVLPLGVDTDFIGQAHAVRSTRPRVVCAGTVYPRKQPHQFVELARRFPQADFLWFGEGELREGILAHIERNGIANLRFPGSLPPNELAREFVSADIMVLPSFAEGVPKVSQEAAAAGLAQIVYGFYETPTVRDGVNGFVVWSEPELAERLGGLLADMDLTKRFGREGAELAKAQSWDVLAPQWEREIVNAVVGAT